MRTKLIRVPSSVPLSVLREAVNSIYTKKFTTDQMIAELIKDRVEDSYGTKFKELKRAAVHSHINLSDYHGYGFAIKKTGPDEWMFLQPGSDRGLTGLDPSKLKAFDSFR